MKSWPMQIASGLFRYCMNLYVSVLTFLQLLGYVIHDHFQKLKLQGGVMAHWLAQLSCNLLVPVRG